MEVTCPDGTVAGSNRFVVAVCTFRRSRMDPWCDTGHRRRTDGVRRAGAPAGAGRPTYRRDRPPGWAEQPFAASG
ncbi:CDGSH iron-sulfur domain-containing protein [Streptomyces sp. NPDC058637]|uniref:CDGSH iron-sulfur domain-containing protein n=1 Tax=Streptomyces sp. NPDC058637 TaxID=3346569 RepID=UPI00364EB78E